MIFLGLAGVISYPHPIRRGPAKPGETQKIYQDAQKAARELGWMPTVTLEQDLEKRVSHIRDSEQIR